MMFTIILNMTKAYKDTYQLLLLLLGEITENAKYRYF